MDTVIEKNLRKTVKNAELYQTALSIDELLQKYALREITKLGSNENPFPPSPLVVQQITLALQQITRYADPTATNIRNALADYYGLNMQQIIMGNGSAEILSFIAQAFINPSDEVIAPEYSFCLFKILTQLMGGDYKTVPLKDWFVDVEKLTQSVTRKTKIIFIPNPNNPTGTWLTQAEVEYILQNVPQQVLIILDEAYFEYNTRADKADSVALLNAHPNLIITRTFSKAYGLAGLRMGYGIADANMINALNRVRLSFNINLAGTVGAIAALKDTHYLKQTVTHNQTEMLRIQKLFDEWELRYLPSATNFLSLDLGVPAKPIYNALLEKGIITRTLENYHMPNYLSFTIGKTLENNRFLAELKQLINQRA